MTLAEIRATPTVRNFSDQMVHESVFRSKHIVSKVLEMLFRGCEPETVIEVINDLRSAPEPTADQLLGDSS